MEINHPDIQLRFLSERFYIEIAPHLTEILEKSTRPYCVLLVKIRGLNFALPLRTTLPNRADIGIKTIPNGKFDKFGQPFYKGIDFSKAVILPEEKEHYLKSDVLYLKSFKERLIIEGQYKKIIQAFKKYLSGYINAMKSQATLPEKYQYSTLKNYHRELKITVF